MKKVLVICIDRDDDLGRKTDFHGPIVGREKVKEAALELVSQDPGETDANTMFDAIKVFDELDGRKEVALLTGASKLGIESDEQVAEQLERVLDRFPASEAVLVTDGAEDEYTLPIIQSRVKVTSLHRTTIKQSQELKGVYYSIIDFIKRTTQDRELSRLILGLPGVAAILYALFGDRAARLVSGIVGAYLLLKGLQLERYVDLFFDDLKSSAKEMRTSFFAYMLSGAVFIVTVFQGTNEAALYHEPLKMSAAFVRGSLPTFYGSLALFVVAKIMDAWPDTLRIAKYLQAGVNFAVIAWIFKEGSLYLIEPTLGLTNFVTSIMLGLIIVIFAVIMKKATVG